MPVCSGVSAYPAKIIISLVMSKIYLGMFRTVRSATSFSLRSKTDEYIFYQPV